MALETIYSASMSDQEFAKYLDVDFPEEAKKHQRLMGLVPRTELVGAGGFPLFSDLEGLVDEKDWKELIDLKNKNGGMLRPFVRAVKDQDGEPSCVSNATVSAHEICQNILFGPDDITELSPISLYRFVGTPRSGSSLGSNLKRMREIGALPLDNEKNRKRWKHVHPHNGYSRAMPSGWEETAKLFRIDEYADIDGLKAMVSALLKGYPVIYARAGHCILAIGLSYRNGLLVLEYLNSWGEWGAALNDAFSYGVGFDSERVAKSASYGAIAIMSVKAPLALAL
jgi:hypothetical protein